MPPTRRLLGLVLLAAAGAVRAADQPKLNPSLYLHITPDHADGSYAVGEPVIWNLKLTGLKPTDAVPSPSYRVTDGETELATGTVMFVAGAAQVASRLDHPGVLRLTVNQPTPWRTAFWCGAAVGLREVKSTVPEPADFDAFWQRQLAELAAVPPNPVLEEVADSGSPEVQLWKLTLDSVRGAKVHGYLARPRGTGPLPAQLQVQYWGLYPLNPKEVVGLARRGWLALNIMAHDLPCDRDEAFYKAADKTGGYNVGNGASDPEQSYFRRMFLSCVRAVDYLAARSDWNHGALLVQGGSQGGFQGLATAALSPRVTALTVFVPGGCDLTGFLEGRPSGWPGWVGRRAQGAQRDALIKAAGYFDAKNFARRIKCPVLVGTGLCDSVSSPLTQFAMFNNLSSPKRLVLLPTDQHTDPHTAYKAVQTAWCQALAASASVPLK